MVEIMSALKLKKAARRKVYAKIGVTAPSGCGKTFSSLLMARGLASSWEKVCLIDSEGSGDKYAGHPMLGPYLVINLFEGEGQDRFSPQRWIDAMQAAYEAGMEVVILDSATHEWQWCLEQKERLNKSINDWKSITPHHTKFVNCILQCPLHVIVCTRRKVEYALTAEKKVEKLGMKSQMRDGFEYELDVNIGLNRQHMATIEKDRAGIFHGRPEFIPTEAIGRELLAWSRAEELKPESERKNTPINIQDPRVAKRIHQILGDLGVPEDRWPEITAALEGTPVGEVRSRIEELAALATAESQETQDAEVSSF
jgi:hypothetical protein